MARSIDLSELGSDDLFELVEMVLDRLPAHDLLRLRELVEAKRQEKLEDAKQSILEEMRGRLEGIGLSLDDVLPQRPARRTGRRTKRNHVRVYPVKYRGLNGETWTGRGRVPNWLQALEAEGRNRDEFLVKDGEE